MHGLDSRAAARARPPLLAVDEQRQRQLVRDRERHALLVAAQGPVQPLADRLAQAGRIPVVEVVGALERRQAGGPEDLVDPRAPDPRDDPLVAEHRVQRAGALGGEQGAQPGGRVGPGLGAERRERFVGHQGVAAQDLHPGGLPGPELAQAQFAVGVEPQQQSGRAVARRRALGVQLQAAGAHQVQQDVQVPTKVDDHVLADPPDLLDALTLDGLQGRVERPERVDAGRERRPDLLPGECVGEPARGDLDLGKLGHDARADDRAPARPGGPIGGIPGRYACGCAESRRPGTPRLIRAPARRRRSPPGPAGAGARAARLPSCRRAAPPRPRPS